MWGLGWIHPAIDWMLGFVELLSTFAILAGSAATFATFPLFFARSYRATVLPVVVFAGTFTVLSFPAVRAAKRVRMQSFRVAAQRAEPVIAAIEKHVANTGAPPATLQHLVPQYIAAIPDRLPPIEIQWGPEIPKAYRGNEWIVSASVTWIMSFDRFLYFPNQQYPESGYGGSLQRIGRWAYVHE
jgi:hypothetical protein